MPLASGDLPAAWAPCTSALEPRSNNCAMVERFSIETPATPASNAATANKMKTFRRDDKRPTITPVEPTERLPKVLPAADAMTKIEPPKR